MIPFGPYELENVLARGGTCEVWRGVHRTQQLPVAVKVGHAAHARTVRFARSFRAEVQAVAQLHHPSIVKVFDYGIVSREAEDASGGRLVAGSPFMVMEMAEATLLAYCGRIAWQGLFQILMSVLDGLAHAHARGVIHRDIKPGNILLVGTPAQVRLADFGLAQPVDQDELPIARHGLLGTPSYMAPEQFEQRWRDYWPWTDLYALGCTAYALVCGRPPFGHTSHLEEMRDAHLSLAPDPFPADVDVAEGFEEWVMRLLQKDPALRYRRAADAAWALLQIYEADAAHLSTTKVPPRPHPGMPFTLSAEGTTALRFGSSQSTKGRVVPASKGLAASSSGVGNAVHPTPSEVAPSGSFHPELHVDSLDSDSDSFDEEEITWVDSFSFGVVPPDGDGGTGTPSQPKLPGQEGLAPFPVNWREVHMPQEDPRLEAVGLGLFGLREIPLVGRERERDVLLSSLQEVYETRRAKVIVLTGPEGSGKSRLAQWLCASAHEVGVGTYVKATHQEVWSSTSGLGPMVGRYLRCPGLSRGAVEARLRRSLEAMRADWGGAREDAIVLTEMIVQDEEASTANDGEGSSITFSQGTERDTAVSRFLERLCGRRVAIAWLDDVQWGLESLEFVHAFLDRQATAPAPVLLVLTAQLEALSERKAEAALLEGLQERGEGAVSTLRVGPLQEQEWPLFFQRLLPLQAALSAEIEQRCAGNPAFGIRLLEDFIERGILVYDGDGFGVSPGEEVDFPESLHHIWSARMARLLKEFPPAARIALELAATLGHDVSGLEWEVVCQEAGIGIDKAWVDAMLERHLAFCGLGDPAEGWSFAHSMCREVLEHEAKEAGRLQEHHRMCAAVLHKRAGELLSYQADSFQLTKPGPKTALAERIGRHLLLSGQEQAALLPLLRGLWTRIEAGEYRLAWCLLADWERLLERLSLPEDHPFWGELSLLRCRHSRGQGSYDEAAIWARKAESEARTHGWDRVLVRALMQLGYYSWFHATDTTAGWRHLEEARSRAMAGGDRWSVARCHRYMGDFLCYRGELPLAGQHFRDALEGFQCIKDLAGMGHALYGISTVERQAGRDTAAMANLERAQQLFADSGSRRGIADCLNAKGDLMRHQGDLEQAERCYREGMDICRALGDANLALGELNLAVVLLEQRAFQDAMPILYKAREAFLRGGRLIFAGAAAICLLPCLAAAEAWDVWDTQIKEAADLLTQTGANDIDSANTAQLAGNMALKAGQFARSRSAYELALIQWDALGRKAEVDELMRALDGLPPG